MTPEQQPWTGGDEASVVDVRESDLAVERLSTRAPLEDTDDELLHMLAGWAAVVDAEAAAAIRPTRRRPSSAGELTAALSAAGVRPVRAVDPRRTPWWVLSAGAAAVIAVMVVGLGAQDVSPVGLRTVAESVQSIESTLVAARMAAEQGDVVGARTLLERARELAAELPDDERGRLDDALGVTEQGVVSAEDAVRRGEPLPAWPDVPGLPAVPADRRPDAPPSAGTRPSPNATPGQVDPPGPTRTAVPTPTPTASTTAPPPAPPVATPTRPGTTATSPTATAPAPTTTAPAPAPAPAPTRTSGATATTTPAPDDPGGPGGQAGDPPGKGKGKGKGKGTDALGSGAQGKAGAAGLAAALDVTGAGGPGDQPAAEAAAQPAAAPATGPAGLPAL